MAEGEEEAELDVVVEERAVVDGLDEVGAAVGGLEDFSCGGVELNFPAVVGADFDDAFAGADVEAVDVGPGSYFGFGDGDRGFEDRVEGKR